MSGTSKSFYTLSLFLILMCQAYEGERAAIVAGEDHATIKGFAAARNGMSQESNPYAWSKYDGKAWDLGWGCWQEGLLPWSLEKIYRENADLPEVYAAVQDFKVLGKLPLELEIVLDRYTHL